MEAAVVERLRRDSSVELHPRLVHASLLYDELGRRKLQMVYQSYIDTAQEAGLPLLICTPTWRANRDRVYESDIDRDVNFDAVHFMNTLRDMQGAARSAIKIGGLIGCKNDCYRPEEGLSPGESEESHSWQISQLAQAGVDFLIAETLPNIHEAIGITKAMAVTGVPYVISFVINRGGCLLDGTPLWKAVNILDRAVDNQPLGFMVNCAHPTFLGAARQRRRLFARLIGYQANASSSNHTHLDGLSQLEVDDVSQWGDEMLILNRKYGVKVLGGCCGTGSDHLKYLVINRSLTKS